MASGSYFPPPVRRVEIPEDWRWSPGPQAYPRSRIVLPKMVVKQHLEPELDQGVRSTFSMGTDPENQPIRQQSRRASTAGSMIGSSTSTLKAFFRHDRLESFDARGTSGTLILAGYCSTSSWWLKAPVEMPDWMWLQNRKAGTPQGGVVSPMLANLFLHYTFDTWMRREFAHIPFERYADDAICHCRTRQEAETLKSALERRFADCDTDAASREDLKVVYCADSNRRGSYPQIRFDFLGFCFRPRSAKNRWG